MNKIKVLIMLPHLRTGGGQQLAVDEAIGLQKDPKFDVEILCMYSKEENIFTDKVDNAKIKVTYLGKGEGASIHCIHKATMAIKKVKPDIVHTHLLALPYALEAALFYRKAKYFHTVHNIADKEAAGFMGKAEKFAYTFTGFVPVAISDYCRDSIVDYYGINKERIPVIYNGIDTQRFACKKEYTKRKTDILRFISIGRMQPVKRHLLMVEAFSEISKEYKNIELVFLGDGELRAEVKKKISELGLEKRIILRGVVKNVEKELNDSHIYLMCSDYEGLPLSILEAMSCGLPVIATKAGGTIDVVDSKNGILCNIGDRDQIANAMKKMIDNNDMREKMAESSLNRANAYDISICAQQYGQLFKKAIN